MGGLPRNCSSFLEHLGLIPLYPVTRLPHSYFSFREHTLLPCHRRICPFLAEICTAVCTARPYSSSAVLQFHSIAFTGAHTLSSCFFEIQLTAILRSKSTSPNCLFPSKFSENAQEEPAMFHVTHCLQSLYCRKLTTKINSVYAPFLWKLPSVKLKKKKRKRIAVHQSRD